MTRKYFGTDGIRGRANQFPMTADMALKCAMATAHILKANNGHTPRVLIGKDTRQSCYMLEQAMTAGFLSMGMDVLLTGPVPTPAVAMLTRSLRCDLGVMISASHNPYDDNGIKIFAADGYKLPDEMERQIENWMDRDDLQEQVAAPEALGKATRIDDAAGRYIEFLKSSLPKGTNFRGLKIVVDPANGAAYKVAPAILWELEADVITMATAPNGKNINDGVGATATDALQKRVVEEGADLGIALDGDADRLILVDEGGRKIDGDQILALLGGEFHRKNVLKNDTVVATVMSNLGLERYLSGQGMSLLRTPVGDRYVVEQMKEHGYTLGGEQSGHMILSEFGTTGDGLLTALQVCAILTERGGKTSNVLYSFDPLPQILKNVRFAKGTQPFDDHELLNVIEKVREDLGFDGRVLVRASGTEPVIRVMAEGDDKVRIEKAVDQIIGAIEKAG